MLGLMVISLMVLFGQMMAASNKNRMLTAGSFFAESILERETARAQETAGEPSTGTPTAFSAGVTNGTDWITTTDPNSGSEFVYRVTATPRTAADFPGETWYLQVEVSWWQDGADVDSQAVRQGHGNLKLTRGRVVYVTRSPP